jgi:UDP-N-acetylglucosamine--N-acetylmuramyl-(pentapeptide) pyrophosphoryl-undecaprenol N-acetylglucosamine transferase
LRSELVHRVPDRAEARRKLGLDPDRTTLLVMGGSQGAAGINALMTQAAPYLPGGGVQIVHLAGEREVEPVRLAYDAAGVPASVFPFCDRMQEVYPAADVAVSRSGAASLGELSWFGVPSVLVPYPYAAEDHQRLNAEIFVRAGAATILAEKEATGEKISYLLKSLLEAPETLSTMGAAAKALAPDDAAEKVAEVLVEAEQ